MIKEKVKAYSTNVLSVIVVSLFVFFLANTAHGATDYYVSASGSGTDCSQASPCATITAALAKAVSDVEANPTIHVSGAITDNVVVDDRASTRAIDWETVTIIGDSAQTTSVDGGASDAVFAVQSDSPEIGSLNATIQNITITNGSGKEVGEPGRCGGGIYNEIAYLTLSHVDINANIITVENSYGGGICNLGGSMRVSSSAIRANSAPVGGGIANLTYTPIEQIFAGTMTLTNVTVSNNTASNEAAGGGGIYNFMVEGNACTIDLINTTIAYNTNYNIANAGTITTFNSLIADPLTETNCYVGAGMVNLTSVGYNIDDDGTCISTTATGDKVGTQYDGPVNSTLADNGGQTPTHAIADSSPAYNAGNASSIGVLTAPLVDQRDLARPARGGYDIGAYELQQEPTPTPTPSPTATPTPSPTATATASPTATITTVLAETGLSKNTIFPILFLLLCTTASMLFLRRKKNNT